MKNSMFPRFFWALDIIEAIYEYFDVHAYGTIVVTLTYDVPCALPSGTNCGYPFGMYYSCAFGCGEGQICDYNTSGQVGTCEACTPQCPSGNSCGQSDGCNGICTGCATGLSCARNFENGLLECSAGGGGFL